MSPDEVRGRPPATDHVHKRLRVLWANSFRGFIEEDSEDHLEWRPIIEEVREWLEKEASDELTVRERKLHWADAGTWSERDVIDNSWDKAAAMPLLWSLGILADLPAFDCSVGWEEVGVSTADFPDFLTLASGKSSRSTDEIEHVAMVYEAAYWRIRTPVESDRDLEYRKRLMQRAATLSQVSLSPDGDLALSDGRSVGTLYGWELEECLSLARERLSGLNWLRGQEGDWDMVTADTIVDWLWDENWPARHENPS